MYIQEMYLNLGKLEGHRKGMGGGHFEYLLKVMLCGGRKTHSPLLPPSRVAAKQLA
uniref:Uncharacterized protein n=1 Tax=Arundo donax TaxID=35708 RepID=A0A0A9U665_ARUDO